MEQKFNAIHCGVGSCVHNDGNDRCLADCIKVGCDCGCTDQTDGIANCETFRQR